MVELYLLHQFVTFVKEGTLSYAAESLHITEPALSRNMKKLETDLEMNLFERKKNKISLNQNGEYVYEEASKLLEEANSFTQNIQNFARKNRTISIGVCAPAPIWFIAPLITNIYTGKSLQTEIHDDESLLQGLDNDLYQLVVLHEKPDEKKYYFKECGKETLLFALPKGHKYARRKKLSFEQMNGENMLLMPDIGFWSFVTKEMPKSRFLKQNDSFSFDELVQASSLPSFATDLSLIYRNSAANRICVQIDDPKATVTYYLTVKKGKEMNYSSLFKSLSTMHK